jgi:hypothetical protein
MKYRISLIFVFPVFVLLQCSDLTDRPVDSAMVSGVYLANHKQGIDMLILREDNMYIHSFTTFEGEQYIDSSNWELIIFGPQQSIRLYNYTSRYESGFPNSYRGAAISDKIIKKTFTGEIKISVDPDVGYWFVKAGP